MATRGKNENDMPDVPDPDFVGALCEIWATRIAINKGQKEHAEKKYFWSWGKSLENIEASPIYKEINAYRNKSHEGGGIDFDLRPDASKGEIEEQRRVLKDAFVRKLKPFVEGAARIKEPLSARPIIESRVFQRHPMPGGGTDDVFEMNVFVENDGENPLKEFLLVLEMPANLPDNGIRRQDLSSGLAPIRVRECE
jgi:hypothetical protein